MKIEKISEDAQLQLHTIDNSMLIEMAENQVEIQRATRSFGKSQSQFMNNTMVLDSHTPLRNLRQLLAEIEKKKNALSEANIKQKKSRLKLEKLKGKEKTKEVDLKIEEVEHSISNSALYIEGALKEIYSMQQTYNDIMKEHNIENWDESDFEREEEEYHIKTAFTQAIGDLTSGGLSQGNNIYFRQIGINPIVAKIDIQAYIRKIEEATQNGNMITMKHQYDFLEGCYQKYKGCSEIVRDKNSLKSLVCEKSLYIENKKEK